MRNRFNVKCMFWDKKDITSVYYKGCEAFSELHKLLANLKKTLKKTLIFCISLKINHSHKQRLKICDL